MAKGAANQTGRKTGHVMTKLMFMVGATTVLLTAVLVIFYIVSTYRSSVRSFNEEALTLAKSYAGSVGNIMSGFSNQFDLAVLNDSVVDETLPLDERKALLNAAAEKSTFGDLSIAYATGKTYNDTDISAREYFQQAIATRGTYVSSPVLRMTDNSVTIMAGRYFSRNGNDYVVYGGLNANDFYETIKIGNIDFGNEGLAWIVDKTGTVVSSNTPLIEQLSTISSDAKADETLKALTARMIAEDSGNATVKLGGAEYIVGYSRISGPEGWSLAIATDRGQITQTIARSIIVMVLLAVVLLLGAMAVAWMMIKRITDPIRATSERLIGMAAGDLTSEAPVVRTGDELETMTDAMHRMVSQVGSYIKDISRILAAMSGGDFTKTPEVVYVGDFEQIRSSFAEISSRLAQIVRNIDDSADGVRVGSGQIADGSQLLAEGSARQATAIEELTATVSDINREVALTAKDAGRAKEISEGCLRGVEEQNREMQELLAAMNNIKEQSQQISNIIKSIEDIAFQTNILSLNASVEAARAGAAGKGFAVVADEVRNLAAKSAESASNTNVLISGIVKAINEGVELAGNAAEITKSVTEQTNQSYTIIGEISEASDKQAKAMEQVSIGITDISAVISQNSATAEQTAASSEELASQSNLLREQVESLRVSK